MKEQIVRQMLRNCCDFCRKLAGVYEYGTEPQEVYMRHDNCRCLVTHRTAAGHYVNVHSKVETDTYKQQRMMRLKELDENGETEKLFQHRRRIARAKNRPYDATEEWYYNAKPNSHKVTEATPEMAKKMLEVERGIKSEKWKIKAGKSKEEGRVAELLERVFGGDIKLMPRVDYPQGIRLADYSIDGVYWDLKEIKEVKNSKNNSVFYAVKHGKGQTRKFVVDISSGVISEEEAIEQSMKLFYRNETQETEAIIIVNGEKIVKVLEK